MNYEQLLHQILQSDVYQRNIPWGAPRPGHPEGTIAAHIEDLERNLERLAAKLAKQEYWRLKVLIHIHDTFKPEAPEGMPISSPGSHASRARKFLASLCDDTQLLAIVQYHDEHLALWQKVRRRGQFNRGRFERLLLNPR